MKKSSNLKKIITYKKGALAEQLAINYLKNLGYKIEKHNFKTKFGEIDIIASNKSTIVAFEIKHRKNHEILNYTISSKQKQRIFHTFQYFLQENPEFIDYNQRLDAIFIQNDKSIDHIENAWENIL